MTRKITTKLLAVLAVTALALVPAFALIDSTDSSAGGEQNLEVEDWTQFKDAMAEARAVPDDTFNIVLKGRVAIEESITVPANVNITAVRDTGIIILAENPDDAKNPRIAIVNEGNITLKSIEGSFGFQGAIAIIGKNMVFVNNGTLTVEKDNSVNIEDKAAFINYGAVVNLSRRFEVEKSGLTNDGTITLEGDDSYLVINGDRKDKAEMINRGVINGTGVIALEYADAVNMGTVTARVYGDMSQESAGWDTSKAGKTISSEGYRVNVRDADLNEALSKLGDRTIEDIVQEAINSSLGGKGSAKISDIAVDLELVSNFAEAEYPNNMILRTAFFKVTAEMKMKGQVTAQLPDAGTYSFNDVPATSLKTLNIDSVIKLDGLLRLNAYFDAGEKLQRVDIILGIGVDTSSDVDLRLRVNSDDKGYEINYDRTTYEFGMGLSISAGLDFNGFDLFSYNPGDEWDMMGTMKVASMKGHIGLTANKNAVRIIDYLTVGDRTEFIEQMSEDLWDNGRTTIDLTELFDLLFGSSPTNAAVAKSVSGAAMAPVSAPAAPANGLFDSFMFTASASVGEDGYVKLTRGPASAGSIDIGEIIFDRLEEEGETAIEVNTEISGDSMSTLFTGTIAVLTGASQEDINGVLKDIGVSYTESNMSVRDMDKVCDQAMNKIDRIGGSSESSDSGIMIAIALVASIVALILISRFIKA